MLSASPAGEVRNILPYLFTGRRVDFLDNGSLTLQYNRHRYYYNNNWQVLCEYDGSGTFKRGGGSN